MQPKQYYRCLTDSNVDHVIVVNDFKDFGWTRHLKFKRKYLKPVERQCTTQLICPFRGNLLLKLSFLGSTVLGWERLLIPAITTSIRLLISHFPTRLATSDIKDSRKRCKAFWCVSNGGLNLDQLINVSLSAILNYGASIAVKIHHLPFFLSFAISSSKIRKRDRP